MPLRSIGVPPSAVALTLSFLACSGTPPPAGFDIDTPVVVRVDNDTPEDQVVALVRSAGGASRPILVRRGESQLEFVEQRAFGTGPVEVLFARWTGWRLPVQGPGWYPEMRTPRSALGLAEQRFRLSRDLRVPGGTMLYVRLLPEKRDSYVLLFRTAPPGLNDVAVRFGQDGLPLARGTGGR